MCVGVCACVCMCIHVCLYVYVYMYVCLCVLVCAGRYVSSINEMAVSHFLFCVSPFFSGACVNIIFIICNIPNGVHKDSISCIQCLLILIWMY